MDIFGGNEKKISKKTPSKLKHGNTTEITIVE